MVETKTNSIRPELYTKGELAQKLGMTVEQVEDSFEQFRENRESLKKKVGEETFESLAQKLPDSGTVLVSETEEPVKVYESWKEKNGQPYRTLFVHAKIDEDVTGWYLHSEPFGVKCLIVCSNHNKVRVDEDDNMWIDAVKIIRLSDSGKALVCIVEDEGEQQ